MKKIVLILALTFITSLVKSQVVSLLVNGGGNYTTFYQSAANAPDLAGIFTPSAGMSIRVQYPSLLGFEIGGFYAKKGAKFQDSSYQVNLDYLGMNLDGSVFFPLRNNDNSFVGAGIFLAGAYDGTLKSDSSSSKLHFGEQWKKFDGGLRFNAGYIIKNTVTFSLHYNIGVFNVFKGVDRTGNNNHGRNSTLNATVSLKLFSLKKDPTAKFKYW